MIFITTRRKSAFYENMHSCRPDDLFNDIIAQPPSSKTVSNREVEVVTEDEQTFLLRQLQLLQQGQQGGQGNRPTSPARTPSAVVKTPSRSSGAGQGSPVSHHYCFDHHCFDYFWWFHLSFFFQSKGLPPGAPSGEGVLANFFNSLLHKKSGSPSGPNSLTSPRTNGSDALTTPDKLAVRTDAAAELDRLTRSVKKEMDFSTPSSEC